MTARMGIAVRRWLAVAVLGLSTSACEISEDQEREIGLTNAEQINSQLPLVTDPQIVGYVNELGQRIARRTSRASLDWRFYVVDSRDVNAFAVPGGFIYINRGLIERTDGMSELAGVLGHEIGHVVLRHSVKQMEKAGQANVGITLLCTLTSMCSSEVTQVAINVAGSAWFAKHSRQDEASADSNAVATVVLAGIDPRGVPKMFETLLRERRAQPSIVGGWFASHPLEEDRIEATRGLVRALGAKVEGLESDTPEYQAFKARVAALPDPKMSALPRSMDPVAEPIAVPVPEPTSTPVPAQP